MKKNNNKIPEREMTELLNPGTNCDCHNNKKRAGKLNELLVKRRDVCMRIHVDVVVV